jgi:predicted amidohydrolase
MKVAIVQFKASPNKEENLEKIISYISKASSKNATLCTFPEFMMFYTNSGNVQSVAFLEDAFEIYEIIFSRFSSLLGDALNCTIATFIKLNILMRIKR